MCTVRSRTCPSTPGRRGLFSFRPSPSPDFGCGKAISFGDCFRKDRPDKTRRRPPCEKEEEMASWQHDLIDPPAEPRARELWLQHAAGFIFCEDVRRYAIERIDPALAAEARAAALKGIDDALCGLMMVIDGVTGGISNAHRTVYIDFIARLATRVDSKAGAVLSEVNLRTGDGMCMRRLPRLAGRRFRKRSRHGTSVHGAKE